MVWDGVWLLVFGDECFVWDVVEVCDECVFLACHLVGLLAVEGCCEIAEDGCRLGEHGGDFPELGCGVVGVPVDVLGAGCHKAEVKGVACLGDHVACEPGPPGSGDTRAVFRGVSAFKVREVFSGQWCAFAEGWHVAAEVVEPDFTGVLFVCGTALEEEDVRFDALGVEDAGGESEDGVEVALVHQVLPDSPSFPVGEEHVVREDDGCASAAFEAAVNVLKEVQLLVRGFEGEIVAGRALPAFLGPKGRVCQHDVISVELLAQR